MKELETTKMTKEQMEKIVKAMEGITQNDWLAIKCCVDREFSNKATRLRLDSLDLENVIYNVPRGFIPSLLESE